MPVRPLTHHTVTSAKAAEEKLQRICYTVLLLLLHV